MDITPAIPTGKKIITSYGGGAFKINDQLFSGNVIIYPDAVSPWPGFADNSNIVSSLEEFLGRDTNIEILIIGCGSSQLFLGEEISRKFRAKGISIEVMTTAAACRTYNVLLAEGRHVGAALVAV